MIKLKPHQLKAKDFLLRKKKAILEMGCRTGKSATAIMTAIGDTGIVCPPSLVPHWQKEIRQCIKRSDRFRFKIYKTTEKNKFSKVHINTLIIDEAHKSNKWSTSEALFRLAKKTPNVYLLTATGLIHSPMDLYWPLKLCNAHGLTRRFFCQVYSGGTVQFRNIMIPGEPTNTEEFKNMCKQVTFYYDRPTQIRKKELYVGECGQKTNKIENYSRLQKLIGFLKAQEPKTKNYLNKICKHYKKIVIFYFHKEVYNAIGKNLPNINGSVNIATRYSIIKDFKKKKRGILFLNYKSCGEGLDIPADACIFLEKTWSNNLDYQAYMRAYGFERNMPLFVYYILYKNEAKLLKSWQKTQKLESFFK